MAVLNILTFRILNFVTLQPNGVSPPVGCDKLAVIGVSMNHRYGLWRAPAHQIAACATFRVPSLIWCAGARLPVSCDCRLYAWRACHTLQDRPSAEMILNLFRISDFGLVAPHLNLVLGHLGDSEHSLQRDQCPLSCLVVDLNGVDWRAGHQVLEAPAEVGQVDPVHRSAHTDDR